jgi:hypothetical protein
MNLEDKMKRAASSYLPEEVFVILFRVMGGNKPKGGSHGQSQQP